MDRKKLSTGAASSLSVPHVDTSGTGSTAKNFHLIWLVDEIDELKNKFPQPFNYLQNIFGSVDNFSESDLFVNFLYENSDRKIVLIASSRLGQNTVPAIHDASQIESIFILCHNKAHHEQWAQAYTKVKGVFNKIDALCQAVEQSVQRRDPSPARTTTVLPLSQASPPGRASAIDDQRRPVSHPSEKEDKKSIKSTTVVDDPHVKTRLLGERTSSSVGAFEADRSSGFSLVNSMRPTISGTSNSKEQLLSNFERLETTLITTAEQELRKSLLNHNDIYQSATLNVGTIDRLQDTLVQTIQKHVTKKKDDSNDLNKLFAELKQVLIDTVAQQQSTLLRDVIRQTVLDAFNQQQSLTETAPLPPSSSTTTRVTHQRKPIIITTSREVKIAADLRRTRIDAAFRQQRDAVVANKRLRDIVQQWSSIGSMADLAVEIKKYGTNDLECAWLLFCWIGQNIQYQPYCNNNAAETVFRAKQGVCRGFASLYHECCSLLGIECSEISGYAKQGFLKPGEELKQSSHAWNSIVLDQYTYLVDPTWGAGGRDYEKKLEDFYFLTSPEEFIYTHYVNGYQLLEPEISKEEFLSLPVMKSTYYQHGLKLLSPKQGLNETNQNLFKIAIRTPAHVDLFAELKVGDVAYPRSLHTLCQRDEKKPDVYNCYIAPPLDGFYEVAIFAKTNNETMYTDAINMRLRVSNIADAFMFPITYATFTEHSCILIEPFQRLVDENEQVLIHMIIPKANVIKIRNGDEYMVPHPDEYKNGVLKKKIRVQGDLQVCGRWDDKADSIAIICIFNMI